MKEEAVFSQFKVIADKKKKPNGMVSRQDIINSLIELCVKQCLMIKNENRNQLSDFQIKEEVFFVCRTMQKMFQYPNEMITEFILPNVKTQLSR
ncbi:MAG: hypothetical protein VB024_08200 [Dysgonamonadaceae bacterium]|nr:hypothetical protein [Dysgonamonadaceae bacterium]